MAGKNKSTAIPIDHKRFLKVQRETSMYRPVTDRIQDYKEVAILRSDEISQNQASRCMDCGVPFCHWGCPVGNIIPEWNKAMQLGDWKKAYELLSATNNFPEFTGRVCPAPCEHSCVLGINDAPVTIRENELAIIEHAFKKGYVKPKKIEQRTKKNVAIIGSGPAGLACAAQLNSAGHTVTVFERDTKIGGLLRYGIPDFKLDKSVIDRRIALMQEEGIIFKTGTDIGKKIPLDSVMKKFDALCLTGGSRVPRDLSIEGRDLKGIHFAMDYLSQSNKKIGGEKLSEKSIISAKNKKVVVIGGGDTGSDCIGTANRQGAECIIQIEVLEKPAECRTDDYPWPKYPLLLKSTSSHEEGSERRWTVLTKKFIGENGHVKKIQCVEINFSKDNNNSCPIMQEIPGSEFEIETDLVILAIGFIHPEHEGLINSLGLKLDKRGNVSTNDEYMSSRTGVFSAGDMRRGQSLIVWAINEGRKTAHFVDKYLQGKSFLPYIK
jgi:glutamate synthase (NADPH/NADH) small chain